LKLDHVAIVVADLEAALKLYTETLGFRILYREIVADQSVEAVGLDAGGTVIELLRPLSEESPVARYRGDAASKLHHTAYRVDDLQAELDRLKRAGVRLIDEHPRKGAHGNQVAFIHPSATAGVLTELCEAHGGASVDGAQDGRESTEAPKERA
jgi:methylmalonyl-CoA epimerase